MYEADVLKPLRGGGICDSIKKRPDVPPLCPLRVESQVLHQLFNRVQ